MFYLCWCEPLLKFQPSPSRPDHDVLQLCRKMRRLNFDTVCLAALEFSCKISIEICQSVPRMKSFKWRRIVVFSIFSCLTLHLLIDFKIFLFHNEGDCKKVQINYRLSLLIITKKFKAYFFLSNRQPFFRLFQKITSSKILFSIYTF